MKSDDEIALMREAGRITAEILPILRAVVAAGMATRELDAIAEGEIDRRGATSAFKGYPGRGVPFPGTVCVSLNDEVVHGIPGDRVIQQGDLVSLDFGVHYRGFTGDSATTVCAGGPSDEQEKLMEVTEASLQAGIKAARVGARLGDVSAAIEQVVEPSGFAIVREYVGHGIGRAMHEEPQIPNFGTAGTGLVLKRGMVLAIEPMVNIGSWRTVVADDDWTVSTADGSLSAHFEHTIAVGDDGGEILTVA